MIIIVVKNQLFHVKYPGCTLFGHTLFTVKKYEFKSEIIFNETENPERKIREITIMGLQSIIQHHLVNPYRQSRTKNFKRVTCLKSLSTYYNPTPFFPVRSGLYIDYNASLFIISCVPTLLEQSHLKMLKI